jgi:hypothetical protein
MADSISLSVVIVQLKIQYDAEKLGGASFHDAMLYEMSHRPGIKHVEPLFVWRPPTTDTDAVQFTAAELCTALWPDSLEQPITVGDCDYPIHAVRIVPLAIGLKIQKADPGNMHFHVELFPRPRDREPFAEVWSRRAWLDVQSGRRARERVAAADTASTKSIHMREADLKSRLRWHIAKTTKCDADTAGRSAHNFIRGGREWDEILKLLSLPVDIMKELLAVRASLESAKAADPGTSDPSDPCQPTPNP